MLFSNINLFNEFSHSLLEQLYVYWNLFFFYLSYNSLEVIVSEKICSFLCVHMELLQGSGLGQIKHLFLIQRCFDKPCNLPSVFCARVAACSFLFFFQKLFKFSKK